MRRIGWRPHAMNPRRAGVRYRCLNPLQELQALGLPVELYDARQPERYAAVIVQGLSCLDQPHEATPSGDAFLDEVRALKARGIRVLVDDCDNHFYNPGADLAWARMAARLRVLLGLADGWIASTPEVAAVFAREAPQQRPVAIVGDGLEPPTALHPGWRGLLAPRRQRDQVLGWRLRRRLAARPQAMRLVWFGSHGSGYANGGMLDLLRVREAIERVARELPLSLTVISNSPAKFARHIAGWSIPTHYLDWSHVSFSRALAAHHVAVIPVEPSPFTVCKTNNRVVTALSHGLAVVADAIPSYQAFAEAIALDDWEGGLRRYAREPGLRQQHVARGQALIDAAWTPRQVALQWQRALHRFVPLETGETLAAVAGSRRQLRP